MPKENSASVWRADKDCGEVCLSCVFGSGETIAGSGHFFFAPFFGSGFFGCGFACFGFNSFFSHDIFLSCQFLCAE